MSKKIILSLWMTIVIVGISFSQSIENVDVKPSTKQIINPIENNSLTEVRPNDLETKPMLPSTRRVRNKYRIRRCCSADHHGSHIDPISEYRKERLNRSSIRIIKNDQVKD